ncbi:hypothetical protein J2X69_003152 [Algoriphagus sp. 4150]|uniref:hypothetical protein n=1 Tax=Algoriphagus sp. 4150 TaxID=2817756 RepID=UPI002860FAFD|nr:hypothetical protein [Algoriphagus sp. 4150]MDR7130795.1 hypothetical protein [Algoriphagus sp. 4150]
MILSACNSDNPFEQEPLIEEVEKDRFSIDAVLEACDSQSSSDFSWLQASIESAVETKDPDFSYSAKLIEFKAQYFVIIVETWVDGKGNTSIISCNYSCAGVLGIPDHTLTLDEYMGEISVVEEIYSKTGTTKNPGYY